MPRTLSLLFAVLIYTSCSPIGPGEPLRETVAALVELSGVPGVGISVVRGDDEVLVDGFGFADREAGRRFTAETQHYIASSTKSFTGLTAALLDAEGRFDLDAPLSRYLPDVKLADGLSADSVTIRQLLTHTHGIANDGPLVFRTAYSGEHTPEILMEVIRAHGPAENGVAFDYGNVGYNVAGMAMDRALGEHWKDLERRYVFEPLGMFSTTAYHSQTDPDRIEAAYQLAPEGQAVRLPFRKFDGNMHAAGGIITTPAVMARWLRVQVGRGMLGGERIFPEAVMAETVRRQAEQESNRGAIRYDGYGLGWNLGMWGEERFVQHNGGFPGFATHVSFMPDREIGVAVFANESIAGSTLVDMVAEYVYDMLLEKEGAEAKWQERLAEAPAMVAELHGRLRADLERRAQRSQDLPYPRQAYAGTYESPLIGRLVVEVDGDRFSMRLGQLETDAVEVYDAENNQLRTEITGSGSVVGFEFKEGRAVRATFMGVPMERVE